MPIKKLRKNAFNLEQSATLAINERVAELRAKGNNVYNMGLGQSPFPVPECVVESLRSNAKEKDYLPVKGLLELRETIAGYYNRRVELGVDGSRVMIGPGSKELLFIFQLVFDGDIIIPAPSWVSYAPQARIVGKNIHFLKTKRENRWELKPEQIEDFFKHADQGISYALILNYPSNPTGLTYSKENLEAIAGVARKHNITILSDEIYGELHFKGEHVSMANYYPEGTIISSGLSKWCGAGGWRLGAFIFPPEKEWVLDSMASVASETFTSVSAPIQYAAIEAFKDTKEVEDYLCDVRRILAQLSHEGVSILHKAGINAHEPEGAFYIFADFSNHAETLRKRGIETSRQLAEHLLADSGVAVLPGKDFNCDDSELFIRISLVDFDGEAALASVKSIHAGDNLPDDFCRKNCNSVLGGLEKIASWIKSL